MGHKPLSLTSLGVGWRRGQLKTIGSYAFYNTKLTGFDLSKATSLVRIGDRAFVGAHRPRDGPRWAIGN